MTRAFIFPGQGSQSVGMGKKLADAFAPARAVFEEVNDALSFRLTRLMWEGPEAELTLTEIGRARVGKECRSRWSPYH